MTARGPLCYKCGDIRPRVQHDTRRACKGMKHFDKDGIRIGHHEFVAEGTSIYMLPLEGITFDD